VVIDGRDRVNCARNCVPALKPDGVVVWDNVERDEYAEGLRFLAESGFRRLDFAGMPPGLVEKTRTAVLYRAANVFGL
jgi:hypothetical protein